MVGAWRPRCSSSGIRTLGPAHRLTTRPRRIDLSVGALRPRGAAELDTGTPDAPWRCGAPDASPCWTGREPVDRGWNGARDDPGACRPRNDPGGAARLPAALLAYERIRRERVAIIQHRSRENGRRYDSANGKLDSRDAQITAQAAFRKDLYAYDVVEEARAAVAAAQKMAITVPQRAGTTRRSASREVAG